MTPPSGPSPAPPPPPPTEVAGAGWRQTRASLDAVAWTTVGSAGGFVLQWVAARHLAPSEFGRLGALLASMALLTLPGGALQLLLARRGAALVGAQRAARAAHLRRGVLTLGTLTCALLLGSAVLLSVPLAHTLHLESPIRVILAALLATGLTAHLLGLGCRQARLQLRAYARSQTAHSLLRLAVGAAILVAGGGLDALLLGLAVAPGLVFAVNWFATHEKATSRDSRGRLAPGPLAREALPLVWIAGGFPLLVQLDVVFVQAHFGGDGSDRAAVYVAAATLGRAVLHFPAVIAGLTFARVARAHAEGRPTGRILGADLATTALLGGAGALAVVFAAEPLLRIYGGDERFLAGVPLLRRYVVPMVLLGLVQILQAHAFALERSRFGLIVGLAGVASAVAYQLCAGSPEGILRMFTLSSGTVLAAALLAPRRWGGAIATAASPPRTRPRGSSPAPGAPPAGDGGSV